MRDGFFLLRSLLRYRPITETGIRVAPPELMHHRVLYDFKSPSCLCASDFIIDPQYTECAVYFASTGKYKGEYVAGCAFDRCGYIGKIRVYVNLYLEANLFI
jgi:hypothetical protein